MFGKKKRRIEELKKTLAETEQQLALLKEEKARLENISRQDRRRIVDISDENKRQADEIQRLKVLERALQELEALQQREKTQREAIAKLIINDESIISLIQQAKPILAEIINLLRFVLEKHPDLNSRVSEYVTKIETRDEGRGQPKREWVNIDISIRRMVYETENVLRGYMTPEDRQKTMTRLFISVAGTFMILYNAIHQLMLLVKEEKRNATIVKRCDEFVINFMNRMYRNIYYAVHKNLPSRDRIRVGYRDLDVKIIELTEEEMKYISEQGDKQRIIDRLNERIIQLMAEILRMLNALRKVITAGADSIGSIYPEFLRIKAGLLTNLRKLFVIFVEHINRNGQLAGHLVELDDREIIEAQREFNALLRHFADHFDESIRQMEFDFR